MDRIDKLILEVLQKKANISNQDLAEIVSLSPSPCLRRVKELERKGYIKKNISLLNESLLNLELKVLAFIILKNHSKNTMDDFMDSISILNHITECHIITGQDADIMLKNHGARYEIL